MYEKTLATSPPIGLDVANSASVGFYGYFISAYNTSSGTKFQGKCDIHTNLSTEWGQLRDVLQYCGMTFNSEAEVQTWFKAQTKVSFINAIRKYLVEVFFPKLKTFVNNFIVNNQTPAPSPSGEMTTLLQGWQAVLSTMDVVYNLDGTIKEFTI